MLGLARGPQEGEHRQHAAVVVVGRRQIELAEDVGDVLLHGARRDDHRTGDRRVGTTLGHQREHLVLARRQRPQRALVPGVAVAHQLLDDLAVQRRAAVGDAADRRHERLHVPHPLLEQVPDPALAVGVEQLGGVDRLDVLGQDQHAKPREARARLHRRADALVGERRREPHVDDRQVGLMSPYDPQEALAVLGLRDHLDVLLAQQGDDALAQQRLVLGDDYSHGSSARITVPSPGLLTTASVPSSACTRWRSPLRPPPSAFAPPGPLSEISITSEPSSSASVTCAVALGACLATLVSDSATTKYAAVSTTGGGRRVMRELSVTSIAERRPSESTAASRPRSASTGGAIPRARSRSSPIAALASSRAPRTSSAISGCSSSRPSARPSFIDSATRRACAPSCRSRSIRRSSAAWTSSAPRRVRVRTSTRSTSSRSRTGTRVRTIACKARKKPRPSAGQIGQKVPPVSAQMKTLRPTITPETAPWMASGFQRRGAFSAS